MVGIMIRGRKRRREMVTDRRRARAASLCVKRVAWLARLFRPPRRRWRVSWQAARKGLATTKERFKTDMRLQDARFVPLRAPVFFAPRP